MSFRLLVLLLAAPFLASAAAAPPEVRIYDVRSGEIIRIFAENNTRETLALKIDLTDVRNATSNGWPTSAAKQCLAGDTIPLTTLFQTAGAPPATYSYKLDYSIAPKNYEAAASAVTEQAGASRAAATPRQAAHETLAITEPFDPEFPYRLPVPSGTRCFVGVGYNEGTHVNRFALDFMMPEGSPVCAARDGMVIAASQDRDRRPPDSYGNFILIGHNDGTSALYADLLENSTRVKAYQKVKAGDIIAESGDTVESRLPHLHFQVNGAFTVAEIKARNGCFSIPTKFNTAEAKGISIIEREWYTAD